MTVIYLENFWAWVRYPRATIVGFRRRQCQGENLDLLELEMPDGRSVRMYFDASAVDVDLKEVESPQLAALFHGASVAFSSAPGNTCRTAIKITGQYKTKGEITTGDGWSLPSAVHELETAWIWMRYPDVLDIIASRAECDGKVFEAYKVRREGAHAIEIFFDSTSMRSVAVK